MATNNADDRTSSSGKVASVAPKEEMEFGADLLNDPTLRRPFEEFLRQQFCSENLAFWLSVERYRDATSATVTAHNNDKDAALEQGAGGDATLQPSGDAALQQPGDAALQPPGDPGLRQQQQRSKIGADIFRRHFEPDCVEPVNIDSRTVSAIAAGIQADLDHSAPMPGDLFDSAQHQIFHLLKYDVWPRFIRWSVTMAEADALNSGGSRRKTMPSSESFSSAPFYASLRSLSSRTGRAAAAGDDTGSPTSAKRMTQPTAAAVSKKSTSLFLPWKKMKQFSRRPNETNDVGGCSVPTVVAKAKGSRLMRLHQKLSIEDNYKHRSPRSPPSPKMQCPVSPLQIAGSAGSRRKSGSKQKLLGKHSSVPVSDWADAGASRGQRHNLSSSPSPTHDDQDSRRTLATTPELTPPPSGSRQLPVTAVVPPSLPTTPSPKVQTERPDVNPLSGMLKLVRRAANTTSLSFSTPDSGSSIGEASNEQTTLLNDTRCRKSSAMMSPTLQGKLFRPKQGAISDRQVPMPTKGAHGGTTFAKRQTFTNPAEFRAQIQHDKALGQLLNRAQASRLDDQRSGSVDASCRTTAFRLPDFLKDAGVCTVVHEATGGETMTITTTPEDRPMSSASVTDLDLSPMSSVWIGGPTITSPSGVGPSPDVVTCRPSAAKGTEKCAAKRVLSADDVDPSTAVVASVHLKVKHGSSQGGGSRRLQHRRSAECSNAKGARCCERHQPTTASARLHYRPPSIYASSVDSIETPPPPPRPRLVRPPSVGKSSPETSSEWQIDFV